MLNVIGELSTEDADRMVAMTPKPRETYGHSEEWPEIIAASVGPASVMDGEALQP